MNYLLIRFSWIFLHFFLNEGGCKFCLMKHVNFISIFFWTLLHWNIIALQKTSLWYLAVFHLFGWKFCYFGWKVDKQGHRLFLLFGVWQFSVYNSIFKRTLFHYFNIWKCLIILVERFAILVKSLTSKVAGYLCILS